MCKFICTIFCTLCLMCQLGNSTKILNQDAQCWQKCLENPALSECRSCRYPDDLAKSAIKNLCKAMPSMTGCLVVNSCANTSTSGYCSPFSLLGNLCSSEMPDSQCTNYSKLCHTPGSVFKQCKTNAPIKNLPSFMSIKHAVKSACAGMPMAGCEQCNDLKCIDPLDTLSMLCSEMEMPQCKLLNTLCDNLAIGPNGSNEFLLTAYNCPDGGQHNVPTMLMYFHSGIHEYLLFKEALPTSTTGFFCGTLVIVIAGVITTWVRGYRLLCEIHWRTHPIHKNGTGLQESLLVQSTTISNSKGDSVARRNMIRAGLTGITIAIDYALMLIAMTFNIWVFGAVVLGFTLGQVFFGHMGRSDEYVPATEEFEWREAQVQVLGMTCDSCVATIQRAVLALKVERVEVDRGSEKATILYNSNLCSIVQILSSITDVGFDATTIADYRAPESETRAGIEIEVMQSCCD